MVLLDSNIFIVDRFFPRDSLYPQNKEFVEQLASIDAAVSAFTLLEICGAASFRLSAGELNDWLFRFGAVCPAYILDVYGLKGNEGEAWWRTFVEQVAANIAKKMTFGDALLLREAENYQVEAIITWNTKDFVRRTRPTFLPPLPSCNGIEGISFQLSPHVNGRPSAGNTPRSVRSNARRSGQCRRTAGRFSRPGVQALRTKRRGTAADPSLSATENLEPSPTVPTHKGTGLCRQAISFVAGCRASESNFASLAPLRPGSGHAWREKVRIRKKIVPRKGAKTPSSEQ